MLTSPLLLFLAAFATCSAVTLTARESAQDFLAPLAGTEYDEAIPNEYVVVFQPGHTHEQHFETIGRNFSNSARFVKFGFGYRANLDDKTRDEQVRRDPGVRVVETNRPVHLVAPVNTTNIETPDSLRSNTMHRKRDYTEVKSRHSPYGLQMITTGKSKLKTPVQDDGTYDYMFGAGQGVQVYIMDTGIRLTHDLFEGRARNFGGLASTDKSPYVNEPMEDTGGHGTHVAGIAGAEQYGAAPSASLINVKVLGDGGDIGHIAQALLDIITEHNENKRKSGNGFWKFRGSVINMSFTWEGNAFGVLYQLIDANDAGISVFAAAGNDNIDAKNTYPCANVQTRCIGAVDNTYTKASFSNYGGSVNFIAPGVEILSLGIASDTAIVKMSGTSMACPHAAGTAAIFASWQGLTTNYDLSQNFVYWNSISGVVSGFPSGTTNNFVTTGIHSPKKYPKEPFRFAGDWPVENHLALNPAAVSINPTTQTPSALPLSDLATSLYTAMYTSILTPISGLTTESGDVTYDPTVPVTGAATPSVTPSIIWKNSTTSTTWKNSTTPTTSPQAAACTGNQIEGSCVQGHLPTATPDSGSEAPVCDKAGDGTYLMFSSAQASNGVSTYCSELVSNNVILSSSNLPPKPGYVANAAENNGYIAIAVLFDVDSCDPGTASADQNLDFGTWTTDQCYQYLYTIIANNCAKDSTWSDYNPDYSLEGGIYGYSCALWSLEGLPGSPPSE